MSTSPEGSTHGHVILRWLAERPFEVEALRLKVETELGAAACFHTCDTTGLTLDGLMSLLAERGKIVREGAGWRSEMAKMCSGD